MSRWFKKESQRAWQALGRVPLGPQPGEAPYRAVNSPVDFSGYEPTYGPVPRLGEHAPEW